jgi:hypothetical protein
MLVLTERTNERNAAVKRFWIEGGKPGNLQTMYRMRRAVRRELGLDGGTFNEELFNVAIDILHFYDVPGHSQTAVLRAVHDFVTHAVRYLPDPAGNGEQIEHPLYSLARGYADCDGLVVLEATLLGMLGFDTIILEAARYNPNEALGYNHIYLVVGVDVSVEPSGLLYLDPTEPDAPIGWHETGIIDWARMSIIGEEPDVEVSGFWSTLAAIGGAVAAPFTAGQSLWVTALASGGIAAGQAGAAALDAHNAKNASEKQIGAAFEKMAGDTVKIFQDAESGEPTPDKYNRAVEAYTALAQVAAQYPIKYVTDKWNSPAYDAAFRARLEQLKARVDERELGLSNQAGGGSNANGNGASGGLLGGITGGGDNTTAIIGLVLLGLLAGKVL